MTANGPSASSVPFKLNAQRSVSRPGGVNNPSVRDAKRTGSPHERIPSRRAIDICRTVWAFRSV